MPGCTRAVPAINFPHLLTMSHADCRDQIAVPGLPPTLEWVGGSDGYLRLIDQTLLPGQLKLLDCRCAEAVWHAIRTLQVRGAPAIGVAAAYGVCLATRGLRGADPDGFLAGLKASAEHFLAARPTAVNLAWALRRICAAAEKVLARGSSAAWEAMLTEAHQIAREDRQVCWQIGEAGADLVPEAAGVLTHCNAGALATAGSGTALSVLYAAWRRGRRFHVYVDETRPLLQGARLTAFELQAAGIPTTVICDSAAASLMRQGRIAMVIVGADRIAANGDTANKIGTYSLAVAAAYHRIPFYVAAPLSSFDLALKDGSAIPIEYRPGQELACPCGRQVVPAQVECLNPAFDVTPAALISGIICERGLAKPVTEQNIRQISSSAPCTGPDAT
jgi:methylthioribose-1-phosphate isomerase